MTKLPHELPEAERAMLGAVLRDPNVYWNNRGRLRPQIFNVPFNRSVMREIAKLAEKGRDFNIPALVGRLPEQEDGTSTAGKLATLAADRTLMEPGVDLLDDLQEAWARRQMVELGERLIKSAFDLTDMSALERLDQAVARVRSIGDALADDDTDTAERAVARMLEKANQANQRGKSDGIPWFLREIKTVLGDELEYGWLIGDLADSGGGKTSLALQQAYFTAKQGIPMLLLSGDQEAEDCYRQMAAQILGVESGAIRSGLLNQQTFEQLIEFANDELRNLPIEIRRINRPKTTEISNHVRAFARRRGRGLVILDHAGKVFPESPRSDAGERYNQIFADLKDTARSTDCAFLALMQRNSNAGHRDNPKPIDVDILGGASVRQNFDLLFSTYFEERWLRQKLRIAKTDADKEKLEGKIRIVTGKADLIGMKARFAREGLEQTVKWEERFTRYSSLNSGAGREPELL